MAENIRLYFDLDSLQGLDYKSIRIYECESAGDIGDEIAEVAMQAGKDYVETSAYSDAYHWFRLEVLDSAGSVIVSADEPVLAEDAYNKVSILRSEIKDTNTTDPAFTSDELIGKMRFGVSRINNAKNVSTLSDGLWPLLVILVRIDICYVLAFDYAKYQKLEIPGGANLARDELYKHYLELAQQLEDYYERAKKDLLDSSDDDMEIGTSSIKVSTMIRDSYETGQEESDISVRRSDQFRRKRSSM